MDWGRYSPTSQGGWGMRIASRKQQSNPFGIWDSVVSDASSTWDKILNEGHQDSSKAAKLSMPRWKGWGWR